MEPLGLPSHYPALGRDWEPASFRRAFNDDATDLMRLSAYRREDEGQKLERLERLLFKRKRELDYETGRFRRSQDPQLNSPEEEEHCLRIMEGAMESMVRVYKRVKIEHNINDVDLDLHELCKKIKEQFPIRYDGENAFSDWAKKGFFWSLPDYATPGFAHRFTDSHFLNRSSAFCNLLISADLKFNLKFRKGVHGVQIFDIGAGPGCAAAGVIKFLRHRHIKLHRVVFLDPVKAWQPAAVAYRDFGIPVDFVPGENGNDENLSYYSNYDTLALLKARIDGTPDGVESIICLSFVLDYLVEDFWGRDLWWKGLSDACGGRRPLILALNSHSCPVPVPTGLPRSHVATPGGYFWNNNPEDPLSETCLAFFLEPFSQRGDR